MVNFIRNLLCSLFFIFIFISQPVLASHIPSPTGYINDFAGVLTPAQKASLESSLQSYEQETTNEIAIALVPSLNGGDIDDFTVRVFEEWKIGKKGKDNGILFLAAIEDRKMRIEVGYGLEPSLTDGEAGNIIRSTIAPEFKKEDYYTGIIKGVQEIQNELSENNSSNVVDIVSTQLFSSVVFRLLAILLAVALVILFVKAKKYPALRIFSTLGFVVLVFGGLFELNIPTAFYSPTLLFIVVILVVPTLIYIASVFARSKNFWAGGVVGAALGGRIGLEFGSIGVVLLLLLVCGGLGLLLDYILSKNYRERKAAGKPTDWWHSGGGFSGGSSSGGFGGGGSGGGGSSGGW